MKQYNFEGTLDFFSDDPHIFKPTASQIVKKDYYEKFRHHNIYLITKTNRVWFHPEMVSLDKENNISKCHYVIQDKYSRIFTPLISNVPSCTHEISVSPFPHTEIFLKDIDGKIIRSTNSMQLLLDLPDESKPDFEVLYIGKSYGRKRRINIIDRLFEQNHKAFKNILIDMPENDPDKQLVIFAYNFTYEKRFINAGSKWIDSPFDKEKQRIKYLKNVNINRKYKVDLIEEALINYFMPKYNVRLKDSLGKLKSSTIEAFRKLDVLEIAVELTTASTGVKLCSEVVPPKKLHIVQFSTFKDKERSDIVNEEELKKSRDTNNDILLDLL